TEEESLPSIPVFPPTVGEYALYLESLRDMIFLAAKDNYPDGLNGKREDVTVLFTLDSYGGLKGEPKVLNEVDEKIVKAVKGAVEKAAPFPPFPEEIEAAAEVFRITIAYE
ncbi:MAG: hypothetical protein U9R52_00180, partial [Candidatus Omnitrophota bacterium]|nr:hypothetical protein [Candidatus Omnitrophota bacterium]